MLQVALLRGINVGGKNSVPMAELAKIFSEAGCSKVRTYIQSGNVIFEATSQVLHRLSERLTRAIEERFGCRTPVILRSFAELQAVTESNPFLEAGKDAAISEDMLHVYFLSELPAADRVEQLDPARSLPDSFILRSREIYLLLPNGMGRTKLTNAYFDRELATICTARNWRTVKKLCNLMSG